MKTFLWWQVTIGLAFCTYCLVVSLAHAVPQFCKNVVSGDDPVGTFLIALMIAGSGAMYYLARKSKTESLKD